MHAKGHLRKAFDEAAGEHGLDASELAGDAAIGGAHRGRPLTWGRLTGLLMNSTDVAPGHSCADLDFPQGSSYAELVRGLRASRPRGIR